MLALAALFAAVVLFADGLLAWALAPSMMAGALYLAIASHGWFSIYHGGFGRLRTVTWTMLSLAWAGVNLWGLASFILPWGALSYWGAATIANILGALPVVGDRLTEWLWDMAQAYDAWSVPWAAVAKSVLLAVIAADVTVLHGAGWRRWRAPKVVLFLGAAAVLTLALGLAFLPEPDSTARAGFLLTPARIVPEWTELPIFALLRAGPTKLDGLVLAAAAPLAWLMAPWLRGARLRRGNGEIWLLLCVALGADWLLLGFLGMSQPEPGVIAGSQVLAAGYFGWFALAFLLGRWPERPAATA